jgi:hypothetical protein
MKAILGALMCLVLTMAQAFALKGGPVYIKPSPTPAAVVETTGTYSGLFVPIDGDNSMGIFTASIPRTGLGTGTVGLFREGIFYPGVIQGTADPDSAILTGVVNATRSVTFATVINDNGPVRTFVVTYNANGSLLAQIQRNSNLTSRASERIEGSASITYAIVSGPDAGTVGPITYLVSGFKQAQAP